MPARVGHLHAVWGARAHRHGLHHPQDPQGEAAAHEGHGPDHRVPADDAVQGVRARRRHCDKNPAAGDVRAEEAQPGQAAAGPGQRRTQVPVRAVYRADAGDQGEVCADVLKFAWCLTFEY